MAPLIMVTLPTISSFFSTCGCFLRVEQSFSPNDFPPLSLDCGWPLDANGSLSCEWRCLHELRVEGSSGARKGGPNRPPKWARPAGPRWRFSLHEVRSFTLQSSGMFLCNTSVPTTIGSDFIKLINTNKTP
jgi:hypothetical protein